MKQEKQTTQNQNHVSEKIDQYINIDTPLSSNNTITGTTFTNNNISYFIFFASPLHFFASPSLIAHSGLSGCDLLLIGSYQLQCFLIEFAINL